MCRRRGLKVNAGKSKVIVLGGDEGLECDVCADGIHLEHVSEFKYLGCVLEVFSDASVVNVDEGKSQIGYVTGLVDEKRGKCPVTWKSKTGKRVAH